LHAEIENIYPSPRPDNFEIHATELMSGRHWCKSMPLGDRLAFRDAWFSVAVKHELRKVSVSSLLETTLGESAL